jgi:hypothetical protein
MGIFHIEKKKGPLLNTLEQFHIHNTKKLQMNDTYTYIHTYIHNPIFDLIVKYNPHNNKPPQRFPPSPSPKCPTSPEENCSSLSTMRPSNTSLQEQQNRNATNNYIDIHSKYLQL